MQSLLTLLEKELGIRLEPDTPLISTGIVDSLRFAELLELLEAHLGTAIDPTDVGVDNFDTPAQMLAFAHGRQGEPSPHGAHSL